MVLSAAMGSGIAAALGTVALEAGDRLAAEVRRFGANIVLDPAAAAPTAGAAPAAAYLLEADVARVLTVFWRHNLVGLAPLLDAPGRLELAGRRERALVVGSWFDRRVERPGGEGELRGGLVPMFPYVKVEGRWPAAGAREVVLGRALAARLAARVGDALTVEVPGGRGEWRVVGTVATGGAEDDQALIELGDAQRLLGRPGAVSRALVSAVTVPLDDFGRRDPTTMTKREAEKWFCTPYVTSVARQLADAVPGSRARPVWTLAEAEARVLSRLHALLLVLAGVAMAAAALAVASTFAARVLGRRGEIALMRACGASAGQIAVLLGAEALSLGALGGAAGAGLAGIAVRALGAAVFGAPLPVRAATFPLAVAGALAVAALGAVGPIRRAVALDPAGALEEAG